jgi:hypothetical protein
MSGDKFVSPTFGSSREKRRPDGDSARQRKGKQRMEPPSVRNRL